MWLFPIASVLRRKTMRMRAFFLGLLIRRGKRSKIHMEITDKIVSKTITQPADLENRFCLIKRDNSISHILAVCYIGVASLDLSRLHTLHSSRTMLAPWIFEMVL